MNTRQSPSALVIVLATSTWFGAHGAPYSCTLSATTTTCAVRTKNAHRGSLRSLAKTELTWNPGKTHKTIVTP